MLLDELIERKASLHAADEAMALIGTMYPLCRSITGDGVRRTLEQLSPWIPLEVHEVPTGTPVYDWEVPREWNIRDAYVADADGHRVVDFRASNLHVVNYSVPVRTTMSLEELQPHLHSLPDRPDWIPYRTSYYKEQWGFCMRHRDRLQLAPGRYEVVIDADLRPGHLSYGECVVPGSTDAEAIVYTHTCHPSLANDNLTGIAVSAVLARAMRRVRPRLTWRFVYGPGTIGSLTWLSRNEHVVPRITGGLVIGLLGDPGALTYKRSRAGATATDRAMEHVLRTAGTVHRVVDFEPYGYDERQFCSPGFDLPVGRLSRSANGQYEQYHTSADDLSLVAPAQLAEAIQVLAQGLSVIDANRPVLNLSPKGEPRLGKRGLYGSVGGNAPSGFEHALLWVLSLADGGHDLVAMAERSGVSFDRILAAAAALEQAGLLRDCEDRIRTH